MELPITKLPITKLPITKLPITELPITKLPIMELPITKLPITELPITELPITELPITKLPITELPITKLPISELPITKLPIINENNIFLTIDEKMSINVAFDILKTNISSIEFMPFNIRDNENIMLYIVNKDGLLIIHGSLRIQNTKSIIIAAILSNKKVLDYGYININNFKNDNDIIQAAILQEPILIANFPDNKDLALKAISVDYSVFEFISKDLKKDKDVIIHSINNGLTLEYIDNDLKYDKDILDIALFKNINNHKYLPNFLKIKILKQGYNCLIENEEFMLDIVSIDGMLIKYGSNKIKNNYSIIIAALINNKNVINLLDKNDTLINLIYQIEYNYEKSYLKLRDIIKYIDYVSKTKNYNKLLKLLLTKYKNICIKKINKKYIIL
jgi:hypothetical protein